MSEQQQKAIHPLVVIRELQRNFPAAFPPPGNPPRPLAVGIFKAIREATRADISHGQLKKALAWWTRNLGYQQALAAGGQRIDLAGNPAGEVTAEQRQIAQRRVADIRANIAAVRKVQASAKRDAAKELRLAEAKAIRKAARAAEAAKPGKGQGDGQGAPTALSDAFQQAAAKVAGVAPSFAESKKRPFPEFSEPPKKVAVKAGGAVVKVAISRRSVPSIKGRGAK